MKKYGEMFFIKILFALFVIISLLYIIALRFPNFVLPPCLPTALLLLFLLCLLMVLVLLTLRFFSIVSRGAKVFSGSYDGNPCFREIDRCMRGGNITNEQYQLCIYYINRVYSSDDVLKIIESRDIEELYYRKDVLEKKLNVIPHFTKVIMLPLSSVIGIFVGLLLPSASGVSSLSVVLDRLLLIWLIVIVMAILSMFIFCSKKGRQGSYLHELYDYELTKIDKCLQKTYCTVDFDDQKMKNFKVQRVASSLLTKRWKFGANKAAKEIMKFTLDDIDMSQCVSISAIIKDEEIEFLLDKAKFPKKTCTCYDNCTCTKIDEEQFKRLLINKYYHTLFSLLEKYYGQKMVLDKKYVHSKTISNNFQRNDPSST